MAKQKTMEVGLTTTAFSVQTRPTEAKFGNGHDNGTSEHASDGPEFYGQVILFLTLNVRGPSYLGLTRSI